MEQPFFGLIIVLWIVIKTNIKNIYYISFSWITVVCLFIWKKSIEHSYDEWGMNHIMVDASIFLGFIFFSILGVVLLLKDFKFHRFDKKLLFSTTLLMLFTFYLLVEKNLKT
jgi:hypothetical protein